MKNLIFILFILSIGFSACKKEEDSKPKTTYKIINNMYKVSSEVQYLDGTLWEVVVHCFNGDNVIREDNIKSVGCNGGTSKATELDPECDKVKISFQLLPKESEFYSYPENDRLYTVSYFYVQAGGNTDIIITGDTQIQTMLKYAERNNTLQKSIERVK